MSQSVARSEKILERLAREDHLTEAAKQWLTVALDPFHDNPTNCTGIPDSVQGNSVVQCIKSSITIAKPEGITTGTWDCNIVMLPFFSNTGNGLPMGAAYSANNSAYLRFDNAQQLRLVYPVTVCSFPTGDSSGYPLIFQPGNSDSTRKTTGVALNGNFTTGEYRIVSQGFEVLNTTPVLTASGLCTCWRSPAPPVEAATCKGTLVADATVPKAWGTVQYLPIQNIPPNTSNALLLPNTKQWLAKEGCYVVGRLNDDLTTINNNSWLQPLIDRGVPDIQAGDHSYYTPQIAPEEIGGVPNFINYRPLQWSNMDVSGACFTGLSLETTLTINWNVYIERFPARTEVDLVVLAKPSPEYCPMAFELYKAISQSLPVGVMQKENGLGDWFRDAVNTASEFIQPIAAMIPHPAAQVISKVAGGVRNVSRRENDSPMIVSEKQEKEYLKPGKKPALKTEKKEIKKEVKRDLKRAVMPQHKKAGKK